MYSNVALSSVGPVAIARSDRLSELVSVAVGERRNWRFEVGWVGCGSVGCGGVSAMGDVAGDELRCRLEETWPGVENDGGVVVGVEQALRIS